MAKKAKKAMKRAHPDATDATSIVRAVREAKDASDRATWSDALVALAAKVPAERTAWAAALASVEPGDDDGAVTLLARVWRLDRDAGVEPARRLAAKKSARGSAVDTIVQAFLLHGGDPAEKAAARASLLATASSSLHLVGDASEAMEDALFDDGADESRHVLLERLVQPVRIGPDASWRLVRRFAALDGVDGADGADGVGGRRAGIDALLAAVRAAPAGDDEMLIATLAQSARMVPKPPGDAATRAAVTSWLEDIGARVARDGAGAAPHPPPPRVEVRASKKVGAYAAPELVDVVTLRDARDAASVEGLAQFVNASALSLQWQPPDGVPALDVRPIAHLTRLERLELRGHVTSDANLEELAALVSLVSLVVGGEVGVGIGDAGIARVAQALPALGKLRKLDLSTPRYGAAGIDALAAVIPALAGLTELEISRDVDDADRERLRRVLPPTCALTSG